MKSIFDDLKVSFFSNNTQSILLDMEGKIVKYSGDLFAIPSGFSLSVFDALSFPESLLETLEHLEIDGHPHWQKGVEAIFWGKAATFDLGFQRVAEGLLWLILARETTAEKHRDIWERLVAESKKPVQLKAKVLVAEDNPFNQKVSQRQLARLGFESEIANNGKEVLQLLEKTKFDIILMDLNMPEMNGYEACAHIRQQLTGPDSKIPIIALSGSGLTASDPGFDAVLKKPIQEALLAQVIRQFVKQPVSAEEAEVSAYIHLDYLREVTQASAVLMVELVDIFLEEVPDAIKSMATHVQNKKWRPLRELAHKTKANFRYVGADEMFTLADTIERYTAGGSLVDQIPDLFTKLEALITPTCAALELARVNLIAS